MDTLATALVEAVMFIAFRDYSESESIEDFEAEDVQVLENLAGVLTAVSIEEKAALAEAVERALSKLPADSEQIPYYRAWMRNMFGDEAGEE